MTYNPNIPATNDVLSVSQGQIQTNFGQLNSQFGIDHTAFYTGSVNGDGKHKQVTLSNVAAPAAQSDPQSILYSSAINGHPELYFKNSQGATNITFAGRPTWKGLVGDTIPDLTNGVAGLSLANPGYLVLPNQLIMQFGSSTSSGTGLPNLTVSLPYSLSVIYSINCTVLTTSNFSYIVSVYDSAPTVGPTPAQFRATVRNATANTITSGITVYWTVICK